MRPWFFVHIKLFARYCYRLARKDGIASSFIVALLVYGTYSVVHTHSAWSIMALHGATLFLLLAIDAHRKDKEFLSAVAHNPACIYFGEYLSLSLLATIISINFLVHSGHIFYLLPLLVWFPFCLFLAKRKQAKARYVPLSKTLFWTQAALMRNIPKQCFEWKSGMRRYKFLLWLTFCVIIQWLGYSFAEISFLSFGIVTLFIVSFYDICEQSVFIEIFADTPRAFMRRKIFIALILTSVSFAPLALSFMLLHFQKFTLLAFALAASYTTVVTAVATKYAYYREKQNIEIITGVTSAVIFTFCMSAIIQPLVIVFIAFAVVYLITLAQKNLARYFQSA